MFKTINNPSSIKFYLFLILTLSQLIVNTYSNDCYRYEDVTSPKKIMRACPMVKSSVDDNVEATGNSTNMVQVTFSCGVSDTVLCNKVQNSFVQAGQIISSVLDLNTAIKVNASFLDFCQTMGNCPQPGELVTLGGARPASTIPLQDDDGLIRHYPQALVKQFQYQNHPQYDTFDILALFNSAVSQIYWFQGDAPITVNQTDFLYVVLHEMVHGLGFTSNWIDYINEVVTSLTPEPEVQGEDNGPVKFSGFYESAFDKYMMNTNQSIRTSTITDQLNNFNGPVDFINGVNYKNLNDFVSKFMSSSAYQLSKNMFTASITPNSLALSLHDSSDTLVLETSLNPFRTGSSVSHVDITTYNNTSDFLMKFLADRGLDLSQLIALRSGNNQTQSSLSSAMGPKLIKLLETLGYSTANYKNTYIPSTKLTSNSLTQSTTNTTTSTSTDGTTNKSSSMAIKPNLIFTSIFIIISMLIKLIYQS